MKNAFSNLANNQLSRKFGGNKTTVADPYVTGYHFIYWEKLPGGIGINTANMSSGVSQSDIGTILQAACLSVTPPGGTLSQIEFAGLGGIKWSVPGNVDYGTTISIKYLEMNRTPILDIHHGWVKMIRDYRTGVSQIPENDDGSDYSKNSYSGLLYYWTTDPSCSVIENFACFDGVFPLKDPQDLFSSDIESIGKLEIDIDYSYDYMWREEWVKAKCQTFNDALSASESNITGITY